MAFVPCAFEKWFFRNEKYTRATYEERKIYRRKNISGSCYESRKNTLEIDFNQQTIRFVVEDRIIFMKLRSALLVLTHMWQLLPGASHYRSQRRYLCWAYAERMGRRFFLGGLC